MILGVTGHGIQELRTYDNESIHIAAATELNRLKPQRVITGMCHGWDMICAAKCVGLGIPFIAAVPFIGQELKWPRDTIAEYRRLLSLAADVVVVSRGAYSFSKMHKRNRWIVDHSSKLLACWNGSAGGTANTVLYALKRGWKFGAEITRIDPGKL